MDRRCQETGYQPIISNVQNGLPSNSSLQQMFEVVVPLRPGQPPYKNEDLADLLRTQVAKVTSSVLMMPLNTSNSPNLKLTRKSGKQERERRRKQRRMEEKLALKRQEEQLRERSLEKMRERMKLAPTRAGPAHTSAIGVSYFSQGFNSRVTRTPSPPPEIAHNLASFISGFVARSVSNPRPPSPQRTPPWVTKPPNFGSY